MTFLKLQNMVFRLMRDTNKTKYDETTIKQLINAAEQLFCTLTEIYYEIDTSITTTVGVNEYSLPSDYESDIAIFYDSTGVNRKLVEINPDEAQDASLANISVTYYYIKNDKLELVGSVANGKTVKIVYYSKGGVMSANGDTPKIPTQYHLALVFHPCYLCCKESDDTREDRFKNDFIEMMSLASGKVTDERYGQKWPVIGDLATNSPYLTDADLYRDRCF